MRKHTIDSVIKQVTYEPNTGCWLWSGALNSSGYGSVTFQGKTWRVHRLIHTYIVGEPIVAFELHHICAQKSCCNPSHLEKLTKAQHSAIGYRSKLTHCPAGHPYSGDNLLMWSDKHRRCKICQEERCQKRIDRGDFRKAKRV